MDVDDDDEYMNAAAAHAAFVMTVSAASMYRLLRHAQHAHDINIHELHPLPEKISLGSADFPLSGTGYIEIVVFLLLLIFCRFQLLLKNLITISMTKIGTVEPATLKKPCLFHADISHDFLHSGTPL